MKNITLLIISIITIFSCSLDYSDTELMENLSDNIPNTIIYKYNSVEIKDGSPVLQFKADKAEVYDSKEETYLENLSFSFYDNDEISNRGFSEVAIRNMKNGNAELKGSIVVESLEENSSLEADTLSWNDSEQLLSSNEKDNVTIKDEDGSIIYGKGFTADLRRKSFFFKEKVEGEYLSNEE